MAVLVECMGCIIAYNGAERCAVDCPTFGVYLLEACRERLAMTIRDDLKAWGVEWWA
jgi:coenzyme F420-reducing hydrogenase gamma subunit